MVSLCHLGFILSFTPSTFPLVDSGYYQWSHLVYMYAIHSFISCTTPLQCHLYNTTTSPLVCTTLLHRHVYNTTPVSLVQLHSSVTCTTPLQRNLCNSTQCHSYVQHHPSVTCTTPLQRHLYNSTQCHSYNTTTSSLVQLRYAQGCDVAVLVFVPALFPSTGCGGDISCQSKPACAG